MSPGVPRMQGSPPLPPSPPHNAPQGCRDTRYPSLHSLLSSPPHKAAGMQGTLPSPASSSSAHQYPVKRLLDPIGPQQRHACDTLAVGVGAKALEHRLQHMPVGHDVPRRVQHKAYAWPKGSSMTVRAAAQEFSDPEVMISQNIPCPPCALSPPSFSCFLLLLLLSYSSGIAAIHYDAPSPFALPLPHRPSVPVPVPLPSGTSASGDAARPWA